MCEAPFSDMIQARSVALTQRRNKENKEIYDRGKKSLLPFQAEWLEGRLHESEQFRIGLLHEAARDSAQDMMNEKLRKRGII